MSLQYYPWYPGDYLKDTGDLSMIEDSAYRRLLDYYYSNGKLPNDLMRLYSVVKASNEVEQKAVDFVVSRFFTSDDNGYLINERADKEIEKQQRFLEQQKRKSALGVKARRLTRG